MREFYHTNLPVTRRSLLSVFRGFHHRPVIDAGEWYDMENLTSDAYPLLSVRPARQAAQTLDGSSLSGCIALHERSDHPVVLCNDGTVRCGGHSLPLLATVGGQVPSSMLPKQVVSMGAWCIVFPDKVWFNAVKLGNGDAMTEDEDYGSIDFTSHIRKGTSGYTDADLLTFTSVKRTGADYVAYDEDEVTYDTVPPEDPEHGTLWCDCSSHGQARMMVYDAAQSCWVETEDACVKLTAVDAQGQTLPIGAGFAPGDGIEISGLKGFNVLAQELDPVRSHVQNLNGSRTVEACGETYIILRIPIGAASVSTRNGALHDDDIVLARTAPQMDYVVSCGNRLWGCRYGQVGDKRVNEIYASKLGDFKNWQSYQGIATDSYAASRGAEGAFTGAAVLGDTPLFFREHSFEKVYPDAGGAHQIVTVSYPGIGRGSSGAAKVLGGTLYYLGTEGVYAYSGSIPQCISYRLGERRLTDGAAGVLGDKYYLSAVDEDGTPQLFVYDTLRGLWHREDSTRFLFAACFEGALYITDGQQTVQKIGGTQSCSGVRWMAESGPIGLELPDQKRITKLTLRLQPELGADARVQVEYDSSGIWHEKCRLHGNSLHTLSFPIVPVRCDHLRLRLSGIGGMKLYSIAYSLEQGSDVP